MRVPRARRRSHFWIAVQRSRTIVYLLAFSTAAVGQALGMLRFSWVQGALVFGLGILSILVFTYLHRRGIERVGRVPLYWGWMAIDVGAITWGVSISGGSSSPFYVWYLANAAAAAFVGGTPGMLAVLATNSCAYIGLVLLTEHPDQATLVTVLGKLALLYGAAFFALLEVTNLREKRRLVAQLRRLEAERAQRLQQVAEELTARTHELDAANERLRQAATTDTLTGLPNRRFLLQGVPGDIALVQRAYGDAARTGKQSSNQDLGFLMIDVDHFKRINDEYGHEAGDTVLKGVAEVIASAIRGTDSVVRWGGEEFLVVARRTERKALARLAERVRAQVASTPVRTSHSGFVRVTCSVGYATYPFGDLHAFNWEDVVALADSAMLLAKRQGRNRSVGFRLLAARLHAGDRERVLREPEAAVEAEILEVLVQNRVG
ncbi:MAG: GGDEF domain-containing protein [Acidobacteria bacterium]|jgi:diguanylate cyclase (GGDEF)-like protein|nr:GGDEF domain-containing protein [Acidobacteriota bacterium]